MNHLIGLGKIFDNDKLNIKILKCLDRTWQQNSLQISETRDLTTLSTISLFGKLKEHELEMKLKEQEKWRQKGYEINTQICYFRRNK